MMKISKELLTGLAVSGVLGLLGTSNVHADEQMQRMYNPNSGEHFYTANVSEKQHLVSVGWKYEGIGWVAPTGNSRGNAVYRLYNRNSGDHHYTLSAAERDWLVKLGWSYEGIGWYSAKPEQGVPLYRLYNPYAKVGTHHYTLALSERDWLVSKGWRSEGIGWYAVRNSSNSQGGTQQNTPTQQATAPQQSTPTPQPSQPSNPQPTQPSTSTPTPAPQPSAPTIVSGYIGNTGRLWDSGVEANEWGDQQSFDMTMKDGKQHGWVLIGIFYSDGTKKYSVDLY